MMCRRQLLAVIGSAAAALGLRPATATAPEPIDIVPDDRPPHIFARAGEVVTCENGHEICIVAHDIHRYDVMSVKQFTDWRITEPVPQSVVKPCPCGAPYIRSVDMVNQLHASGEWRR